MIAGTHPKYPQVIYLHGSVDHYTDQNIEAETQALDQSLVDLMLPVLRDYPLVVVGYRGWEPSVMQHLLIDQASRCGHFAQGIYWCQLPGEEHQQKTPLLEKLELICRGNLQFVEIEGFDELMDMLDKSIEGFSSHDSAIGALPAIRSADMTTHDLLPSELHVDALNEPLLRAKILAYYETSRLGKPDLSSSDSLGRTMVERSLAIKMDREYVPTRGAQLLFCKEKASQLPTANCRVTLEGPKKWIADIIDRPFGPDEDPRQIGEESLFIAGDLWSQIEQLSDLLARVNRPFRLKGPHSQDVYPYPALALKELLTNMVAHRAYDLAGSAELRVTRQEIHFENPGGLVDNVRTQLEEQPIQQVVGARARRVKGYRNPVIADFFYSAGAMDKLGSGLPDVILEAENNSNEVTFGPTSDNARFFAVIKCRPEALHVDEFTGTSKTSLGELRYSSNLLPIVKWPNQISKLGTIASYSEVAKLEAAKAPPFSFHRSWLWTFADLGSAAIQPLLSVAIEEERHSVPVNEWLGNGDNNSSVSRLLNMALSAHLVRLGLYIRIEGSRIRAYFPTESGGPREVTYKGRFKTATRTVTKPIVSRSTGEVMYWEHKAAAFRFERFGDTWALAITPSYVFTEDGEFSSIASERIGPLTTKRASRDYNPTVLHDIVFWSRILSGSEEPTFSLRVAPEEEGAPPQTIELSSMVPTWVFQESVDAAMAHSVADDISQLAIEELQESIGELIEEVRAEKGDSDA